MTWYERIIEVHKTVTNDVSHGLRLNSERYFVWQEDGTDSLPADNRHVEASITGTTDLFTRLEFDPWRNEFESALEAAPGVTWDLLSIQYEDDTGFWHYEWEWSVIA